MGNADSAPEGRFGHEAALDGDNLFVWGGVQSHNAQRSTVKFADRRDVWCFDTNACRWNKKRAKAETKSDVPPPCVDARCAVVDGTVYSFGGCSDVKSWSCLNDVYALDLDELRWTRVAVEGDRPTRRTACGMCSVQGGILVVGGYGRRIEGRLAVGARFIENPDYPQNGWSNEVLMFSPLSCSWRPLHTKTSTPLPRAHHSLTACQQHTVVLFGGRSQIGRLSDLHILNMLTEEWVEVLLGPSKPEPRAAHTASYLSSDYILVLGGWNQYEHVARHNYTLDIKSGNVQKVTFVGQSTDRSNHSICCQQCQDGAMSVTVFGEPSQPSVLEEIHASNRKSLEVKRITATNGKHKLTSGTEPNVLAGIN
ncbi:kelch domain-containing protein 2-like isoform X2 [Corticium candelabrum]|uniref:kelch domain-containing protein 2-like isoform X2 n=1 Tax=Corticium candelabrum TaxID=121492 RepID=UPI002E26CEC4|nr:kelch domain-containing protein 2-like isoform X2 [Corticium candelabrum]